MTRSYLSILLQIAFVVAFGSIRVFGAGANDEVELAKARAEALKTFKSQVVPFMATYCGACHAEKKHKGGVTFQTALKIPNSPTVRLLWKRAAGQIKSHDMPPEDEKQPTEQERKAVVDWI